MTSWKTLPWRLMSGGCAGILLGAVLAAQPADGPLKTYRITVKDLPEGVLAQTPNAPKVVPQPPGASLDVPPGFEVTTFAEGFKRPRWAVEAPNGDVFVSDPSTHTITVLHDTNGNQTIDDGERTEFASGLKQPFGMAFFKDGFYVANTDAVVRFPYKKGQRKAEGAPVKLVDLPSGPSGHWTRNLAFSPDGKWLYVAVGSASNVDPDPDPLRAAILRFKIDGTGREVVATGIRNPIGLSFHPKTRELWMAVQERDGLGADAAPDYVARVQPGAFYGWPYAYIGANGPLEEPRRKGEQPDAVKKTAVPEVLLQAHSAVLGLTFYDGKAFPEKYRQGAFAALRGSSGRASRTGYKVVFLPFDNGKASGGYEDFVAGWMLGADKPEVWGRPVGLAVRKDGSLLVTDDAANKIWRVSYKGPAKAGS